MQPNNLPGRNDPCPCGSGRKYKHCCAGKDQAIKQQDNVARAQYQRGLRLEKEGREAEAVDAYRFAAALSPALPEANSRIGHLLLAKGRITEASIAFRAAAGNSEVPERRLDLIRALMIEEKDAEAELQLRRFLEQDPKSGDGYWLLGRLMSEAGRFIGARAALERAIALDPANGAIYYDLVRTFTLTPADRPLVNRMLAQTHKRNPTDQRIRLHFGLGKAFDDLKDYGAAMLHFAEANRIKSTLGRLDRNAFVKRIDNVIERFTSDFIAAHVGQGSDSLLPVLVLGMPRSGTTLVEQIISSHRQVIGAGELQFWNGRGALFDKMLDGVSVAEFQRQAAHDYLSILQNIAPQATRVTDKAPFNFLWAGLIHLVFPRAVICHCRRNPIDTCLSIFSTYFGHRADFSTDRDDLAFYYRHYLRLMAHWRMRLPTNRFVDVDYEVLVSDPENVSRQLVAACGLAWDPACLEPERNERIVRSASKWQARQPIHDTAVGRWRRYEPWIGGLSELTF